MEIMIKLKNADYADEQVVKSCLEQIDDISFEVIEEDGIDGFSIFMIIISSGTLAAAINAVENIYRTKIKSISEEEFEVKITKDGIEVKAPTLDGARNLLIEAYKYKEALNK